MIIEESIKVPKIGHRIVPYSGGYLTEDYLVDQSQSSGGGGIMSPLFRTNLGANNSYRIELIAPKGKKFQVTMPPEKHYIFLDINIGRIVIPSSDGPPRENIIVSEPRIFQYFNSPLRHSERNPAKLHFKYLSSSGREPLYTIQRLGYFDNVGVYFRVELILYNTLEFESIILEGQYSPPSNPTNASLYYYPAHFEAPPQRLFPNPRVYFWYNTSTNFIKDPGKFVRLI